MLTYAAHTAKHERFFKGAFFQPTYADVCWRTLAYADVCRHMLTYADLTFVFPSEGACFQATRPGVGYSVFAVFGKRQFVKHLEFTERRWVLDQLTCFTGTKVQILT